MNDEPTMVNRDYKVGFTFDFNDPRQVEGQLAKLSQIMLADTDEAVQRTGLWLKNEAVGFTAALADFQRHDYSPNEAMNSLVNAFAHLLVFATMSMCGGQAKEAGKGVIQGLSKPFFEMLNANSERMELKAVELKAETVH